MASIGGLSSSTSSSIGTLRGYGGLGSGLDRDSLIESMTAALNSRIETQQAKKTKIQWKQTAVQNISSKMIAFSEKYVSTMTSSSNLYSSTFWGQSNVSVMGSNSKYVTATGTSSTADTFTVAGVKQLAQKASLTSGTASDRALQTGDINFDEMQTVGNLKGKTLSISFDGKTPYTVVLPTGLKADGTEYDYTTTEGVAEAINAALKNTELRDGNKYSSISNLGDVLQVSAEDGGLKFSNVEVNGTNTVEIQGGTALEYLGIEKNKDGGYDPITLGDKESTTFKDNLKLTTQRSFKERIAGQTLDFTYNGKTQTIKMPSAEELENISSDQLADTIQESLQTQLDNAFGKNRIQVKWNGKDGSDTVGKFEFTTVKPDGQDGTTADASSILKVSSGSSELLGSNSALKMEYGESNRVNLSSKLVNSGLAGDIEFNESGEAKIKINDKEVLVKKTDTVADLISRINRETDVNVTYQASSDTFTFISKQDGASGEVRLDENAKKLFNSGDGVAKVNEGKDAIISVRYTNTDEVVDLVRGTNSFEMEGLTITVKNTFGQYDADDKLIRNYDDEVSFNAEVDADKITNAVKQMVEEINEIIAMVNKEVGTKPDNDYSPLTASQKKEMSDDEIEAWEEKAKEGVLFNDNDIKNLSWDLSSILSSSDLAALKEIGIATSDSYSDNGKLVFDETKFRAALASDPQKVQNLFTKKAGTDANGNTVSNGIAANLEKIMNKYVSTMGATKGILVEKAGSAKSPLSVTNNSYYNEMKTLDELIESLQTQLKSQQDRYISQFTTLETMISQMNSQSSMLSSLGGGY